MPGHARCTARREIPVRNITRFAMATAEVSVPRCDELGKVIHHTEIETQTGKQAFLQANSMEWDGRDILETARK